MNIKAYILTIIMVIGCAQVASAQRIIGELESNTDMDMIHTGDSLNNGRNGKKEKKDFVPVSVKCWTVDEIFGNVKPTTVDTLTHLYQNVHHSEGLRGHYNTLSNVGSPRLNRIFMERRPMTDFIFTDPLDQFFVPTDQMRHYNTKSPYVNISYQVAGDRLTGHDHVKAIYSQNIGRRTNLGARFNYIYGQGYYDNQSTSEMGTTAWASHHGDRYNFHLYYTYNTIKLAESGGIEDEGYITQPENQSQNFGSKDIPTMLRNLWSYQDHHIAFYTHSYNFGFYRTQTDSIKIGNKDTIRTTRVYVPASKIFHTVKLNAMERQHLGKEDTQGYYARTYLPGKGCEDETRMFYIRNNVGLSMCEGFQKWAVFGLNVYAAHEYKRYTLPDTLLAGGATSAERGVTTTSYFHENNFMVGGQLIRQQAKMLRYNVDAEVTLLGTNIGQFSVEGNGDLNFRMFRDTTTLHLNAYIKNVNPSFYHRHFHAKNAWWDRNPSMELRQRVEGSIHIRRSKTKLTVGFENIKNYAYFANVTDKTFRTPFTGTEVFANNIVATSCSDNIQVLSANLQQDFKLGPLCWDNDVTYQLSSNPDVLPLPTINVHTNLYFKFSIAKVLHTELGADMTYFTSYYAPDYAPVIGQFTTQNANKRVKIGNYPLISVYANFDLKRCRFYVQYYHVNQGSGRYFWAPNHPMNPGGIHLGLNWNFYD